MLYFAWDILLSEDPEFPGLELGKGQLGVPDISLKWQYWPPLENFELPAAWSKALEIHISIFETKSEIAVESTSLSPS